MPDPEGGSSNVSLANGEGGGGNGSLRKTASDKGLTARRQWITRCLKRKPLEVVRAEESEEVLERTLGFLDLFALGFGGTVGSGVFVMTGLICHELAGPAGMLSWMVAGFGCFLNAASFAELSWRVPSAGGAYAYTFVALGELPAAIVGWCMTLEYGVSGAAVAKSWGEMLSVLLGTSGDEEDSSLFAEASVGDAHGSSPGRVFDLGGVYAAVLQIACVLLVIVGLRTSKMVVNVFCSAKALLVLFMTVTALTLFDPGNLVPFAPFGGSGVLKGAVSAFFGYLGFDEVVLLAPEAKDPAKHVPRALFFSLVAVTAVCALASFSLSGALPAEELDPDSAFAEAFRLKGMRVAHKITAIGELVTLPLVVLVSFMAQPRLLFAMAKDGLMPKFFAQVDSRGILLKGSLACGFACTLVAALVPFDGLDDLISSGVLFAFTFVTSSLLVLRHSACCTHVEAGTDSTSLGSLPHEKPAVKEGLVRVLVTNLFLAVSSALAINAGSSTSSEQALLAGSAVAGCGGLVALSGLKSRPPSDMDVAEDRYRAPFFPWVQAGALWVNWFLVCQLPPDGLIALAAYVAVAVLHYLCYGWRHSVGNCSGWSLLLDAAEAAKGEEGTTVFAGMDAHHGLGGVSVEEGVDAPLLGKGKTGDIDGEGSDEVIILDGGEGSPDSAGVMPAPHASRTPELVPSREKLVRRRSSEVIR